jgi:hypothetical protein
MKDLLRNEPALAWKHAVGIEGRDPQSPAAREAAAAVRRSAQVEALLAGCDRQASPYKKWDGRHWVISLLADLGCPPGDESLRLLVDATVDCWLHPAHPRHVQVMQGRVRRCASQEGNAVWSALRLGFADGRVDELVARLLKWQWPDGGWNCDKHPEADTSSFMETLIPLRALALYARVSGDGKAAAAAERAAEVFLSRRLFLRRRDGRVMDPHFVRLHYPCYWHYDILFALKVMAEAGFLADPRCRETLDLLESRRLPDGGFPAEESYARPTRPELSGYSPVSWGGTSKGKSNPFVSADALSVLRLAGRSR